MIFRVDKLLTALPVPRHPSAEAAAAVQELMGGKAGEMSTLMNYFFQTINFRDRENYNPYYKLIGNIAAEEWGHVELVASAINMLLSGTTTRGHDPAAAPLADVPKFHNMYNFFNAGQTALPIDSMGNYWNGSYVHSSGSLKLDLVHNFFLELNARATKLKVYETTSDPTVRELTAFLLVRGSTHVIAYAKALETLSGGVEVSKLFPIPELSTDKFPEARKYVEQGLYNTMYSFSKEDISQVGEIWKGAHPDKAPDLVVTNDPIPTIADIPVFPAEPQLAAPSALDPEEVKDAAKRIFGKGL
ncbi:manganese catalase family protein [Paludisphaera soli]|uniref:manganese catalase family protein n=1 Tax=Paludisphaera soli TaxID=2712865 RepID=UPI0013EDC251|nr:manganese catalase family protein [Paludisphaera soli]